MPLYQYRCSNCGLTVERFSSVDERDFTSDCWCFDIRSRTYFPFERVITPAHLHGSPNMPNG